MKKIPTLFERVFENRRIIDVLPNITPGCEEAFLHGDATIKFDGSCCAIIDGVLYKRYDAKKGKKPPEGAIPCCDPDPVTGHWPHWVKVDENNPSDKWFVEALKNYNYIWKEHWDDEVPPRFPSPAPDGTYEAAGLHFNGNPYNRNYDTLIPHGTERIHGLNRDFESVKEFLRNAKMEGIVFWLDDVPVCKIKRTDFGFEWPIKEETE